MFGFWILLSGKLDYFHLALGVISSIIVAFMSGDLLFGDTGAKGRIGEFLRFVIFVPWILREIFVAATDVAFIALSPGMNRVDPQIARFRTRLKRDVSRVVLATAITLTPGTITIRITDDEYLVHALSVKAAKSLPGEMEERIGRIFGEF